MLIGKRFPLLPKLLLSLVGLATLATSAAAQDKPDIEGAKRAFKAGQQFLQMKRYPDAIVEFNKAFAITKDGLVMGQVALAYEKAGDYDAALSAIRVYRGALPSTDRASVDALIEKYESKIARGESKRLILPGEQVHQDPPPVTRQEEEETTAAPTDDSGSVAAEKGRFWTWIAAGTAAALGVTALAVGLSAQSKFSELEDRCGEGQVGVCAQSDIDSVNTRATVTDVLWPMALAAGITAGVLFFLEKPVGSGSTEEREDDDLLDDEEEEDDLVKDWRVSPVAGAGVYGLGASFSY